MASTATTTQHTPTPWRFGHTADSIVAGDAACNKPGAMYYGGELVAESMNHHDRDFVLRACNSRDQLVAALRGAHAVIDTLMARMIDLDPGFLPSKSSVWPQVVAVAEALAAAEA